MKNHTKKIVLIVALACLISDFIIGYYFGSGEIPFVSTKREWSIGIYTGKSPFSLVCPESIKNPVLTSTDVTDVQASFVADPFMVNENRIWYMFFEVLNTSTQQGDIGLAISKNGLKWKYQQIVLDEPFHLSYPHVFKWQNEYYMIPESRRADGVRLYKAASFPNKWVFVKTIIRGDYGDSSIIHYNDRWWLFVLDGFSTLKLYYSNRLIGPWTEHPKSPLVVSDGNISRPGGRMVVLDGKIIRYTQDGVPTYGNQLRAFKIDVLTTTNYEEHESNKSPILKASGSGWNAVGMHHIDPHRISKNRWIACVDGVRKVLVFGFKH